MKYHLLQDGASGGSPAQSTSLQVSLCWEDQLSGWSSEILKIPWITLKRILFCGGRLLEFATPGIQLGKGRDLSTHLGLTWLDRLLYHGVVHPFYTAAVQPCSSTCSKEASKIGEKNQSLEVPICLHWLGPPVLCPAGDVHTRDRVIEPLRL